MTPDNSPSEEQSPELRAALEWTEPSGDWQFKRLERENAIMLHAVDDEGPDDAAFRILAQAVRDLQAAEKRVAELEAEVESTVKGTNLLIAGNQEMLRKAESDIRAAREIIRAAYLHHLGKLSESDQFQLGRDLATYGTAAISQSPASAEQDLKS